MSGTLTLRGGMAAVVVIACLGAPGRALGEERITAYVETDGKVVFTNLATYTPPPGTSRSGRPAPRGALDALINGVAAQHGVDPALVRAVIEVESSFNPHAVSPKGALGLMQLIPETGRRFGVSDFFDPAQNVEGGVRYLRFLLEKFQGSLDLSLAAYNSGENRVQRLGRIPAIPETRDYVRKVRTAYSRMGGGAVSRQETPAPRPGAEAATSGSAGPAIIHRSLDDRGITRFSNLERVE